jgi:hypothetical protein
MERDYGVLKVIQRGPPIAQDPCYNPCTMNSESTEGGPNTVFIEPWPHSIATRRVDPLTLADQKKKLEKKKL